MLKFKQWLENQKGQVPVTENGDINTLEQMLNLMIGITVIQTTIRYGNKEKNIIRKYGIS